MKSMHSDHLILIVIKALDYLIKVNAAFRSILLRFWGAGGGQVGGGNKLTTLPRSLVAPHKGVPADHS